MGNSNSKRKEKPKQPQIIRQVQSIKIRDEETEKRQVAFALLLIFLFYAFYCVYGIWTDNPSIVNAFYQPQSPPIVPIGLAYPSLSNGELQNNWLQIFFTVETNSSYIAENTNLTLTNVIATTFPNSTGMNIDDVWVGFQYAQPYSSFSTAGNSASGTQNNFFTALDGDWLGLNTSATTQNIGSLSVLDQMTFHFPASGDYSPSIIIGLFNGTFLTYNYNQIQLHVMSNSEVESLKVGRTDIAVTISLLAFAGIEGISVVNDLFKKKREYLFAD